MVNGTALEVDGSNMGARSVSFVIVSQLSVCQSTATIEVLGNSAAKHIHGNTFPDDTSLTTAKDATLDVGITTYLYFGSPDISKVLLLNVKVASCSTIDITITIVGTNLGITCDSHRCFA